MTLAHLLCGNLVTCWQDGHIVTEELDFDKHQLSLDSHAVLWLKQLKEENDVSLCKTPREY